MKNQSLIINHNDTLYDILEEIIEFTNFNILKISNIQNIEITDQNFWSIILSFIFSYMTLKIFLKFLKKFSLIFFVFYRILLGIVILTFLYL